jgi:predicted class III extradiol MEMO1 family dioxygenase
MPQVTAQHHPGCYPSDPDQALAFFRDALSLPLKYPDAPSGTRLAGIIAPHLGPFQLALSSYVAGFQPLLQEPLAEAYLILGVGHRSRLEWNLDRRDYVTPFGRAACATELVDALAGDAEPRRLFLPSGHEGEHSIEFPVVWLQALHQFHPSARTAARPVRFVPLLCGGLHPYIDGAAEWDDLAGFHRLAESLGRLFETHPPGEKLRVIVSIDGCHMGPRFDHPFRVTSKLLKATAAWENALWSQAAGGDARVFLDWLRREGNDRYFDGVGALALLMHAAPGRFAIQRTDYGQFFTERDASVVTYSSGRVLMRQTVHKK